MPSRKGMEQCITWLKSKMAEKDTLDALNAEVCYNVIMDLKRQKTQLGSVFHNVKTEKDRAQEELERMKLIFSEGNAYDDFY